MAKEIRISHNSLLERPVLGVTEEVLRVLGFTKMKDKSKDYYLTITTFSAICHPCPEILRE